MPAQGKDWIDYLTLAAALIAAIGPLVKIWEIWRTEKERFDLHIDWVDFGPNHPIEEAPFLYALNKSKDPILITEVRFSTGLFWRKVQPDTALGYLDPLDLSFPYLVEPGQKRDFMLQSFAAEKHYEKIGFYSRLSAFFQRSWLWLEIETTAGTKKIIGSERAMGWHFRPAWTKIEKVK